MKRDINERMWEAMHAFFDRHPPLPQDVVLRNIRQCVAGGADINATHPDPAHPQSVLAYVSCSPIPASLFHGLLELGANPLRGALQCALAQKMTPQDYVFALLDAALSQGALDLQGRNVLGVLATAVFPLWNTMPLYMEHVLRHGVNRFHVDHDGNNALHVMWAAPAGWMKSDPNPLIADGLRKHPDQCELLLHRTEVLIEAGLDLDAPNADGVSARDLIKRRIAEGFPMSTSALAELAQWEAQALARAAPPSHATACRRI